MAVAGIAVLGTEDGSGQNHFATEVQQVEATPRRRLTYQLMKSELIILVVASVCSAFAYVAPEPLPSLSGRLSINGIGLGMSRADVDKAFGRTNRVEYLGERSRNEHFGMPRGCYGYGDGTSVSFYTHLYKANVEAVGGVCLEFDGKRICREYNGLVNPGERAATLKRTLGEPDVVTHDRHGVHWTFRRHRLTVNTDSGYFALGQSTEEER